MPKLVFTDSLHLLARIPLDPVLLDVVWDEVVAAGISGGYADASALESSLVGLPRIPASAGTNVDASVLAAAVDAGVLVANDLALGRRARNLGVTWLRSADLALVGVTFGAISSDEARGAIIALRDSCRITPQLAAEYLEEL